MGVFSEALEIAKSGSRTDNGNAAELYALACGKAAERLARRTKKPVGGADMARPENFEAVEFELKILQSLALCGWTLDRKKRLCTKSFIGEDALALADTILELLEDKNGSQRQASLSELEIRIAQAEMDALLTREAV